MAYGALVAGELDWRPVLIRIGEDEYRPIEPRDVYMLEAEGYQTRVRLRRARPWTDLRELSEVLAQFEPYGFVRVHRSYAVNVRRVRVLRRRDDGRDWEIKLEPPVNRVVPVARSRLDAVHAAFGARKRRRR